MLFRYQYGKFFSSLKISGLSDENVAVFAYYHHFVDCFLFWYAKNHFFFTLINVILIIVFKKHHFEARKYRKFHRNNMSQRLKEFDFFAMTSTIQHESIFIKNSFRIQKICAFHPLDYGVSDSFWVWNTLFLCGFW